MKILIVTQYFYPETFIINEIITELEKLGVQVSVLTGKPNYPDGKIFDGYSSMGLARDKFGTSTEVIRVPLIPRGKGGAMHLTVNYLSFVFFASLLGPFIYRRQSFDVVFVFAPSPILVAIPAILINLFKKSHLALWVQDLWPESLSATGFVKSRFLLTAVRVVVRQIYRACDAILIQSDSFRSQINSIYLHPNILYYPNSYKRIEESGLPNSQSLNELLSNHFCLVFAGNIGTAQSVHTIVEAAKLVADISDLKIVFVGSGSMLSWVIEKKEAEGLNNIECIGRVSPEHIPAIYAKAHGLLLTLKSEEIFRYTLPWKTQSYMAAGKPILGAIDGEGARVVSEADCGLVGPAEDFQRLAINIREFYHLSESTRIEMGQNAKDYFERYFEMCTQVKKLVSIFNKIKNSELES